MDTTELAGIKEEVQQIADALGAMAQKLEEANLPEAVHRAVVAACSAMAVADQVLADMHGLTRALREGTLEHLVARQVHNSPK